MDGLQELIIVLDNRNDYHWSPLFLIAGLDRRVTASSPDHFGSFHMLSATAQVSTAKASINLKKLCRHFGHKVEASFDDHRGEIHFAFGDVFLVAEEGVLSMKVQADNEENLATGQKVMADHLVRFASDEPLQVDWQPPV